MTNNYITFGAPLIEDDEINEVVNCLKSGWIGTGPKVRKFEDKLKKYIGTTHALALNSCTAALHLSLLACKIGDGDEVITTPLTFCASINSIIHSGAKPVLVDIKKDTMNIDETKIEEKITKQTKAIMVVHMAGRPCEMDKIISIAKKYNLYIIEDAAHAIGAKYKGAMIGSLGNLGCFSFYATKNITTGEGGLITTNNKDFADVIKIYSLHGMTKDAWKRYSDDGYKHYEVIFPGFKYNMTDIQAAIGIHQIEKIEIFDKKRQKLWDYYNQELNNLPITLPTDWPPYIHHAKHLYTILIDPEKSGMTRDQFMQKMHENNIGTGIHFTPIHTLKYYKEKFKFNKGDYPNAEYIGERTVSIPLSAKVTKNEAEKIVNAIKKIINK